MGKKGKALRRHNRRVDTGALVEIQRGWRTLRVKPVVAQAHRDEPAIRSAAAARECGLVVSEPLNGMTYTLHFQFNRWSDGSRALDWWPGSGTWRKPGASGKTQDYREVIALLDTVEVLS